MDIKVTVFALPTLYSSRGVIRCREISDTPLEDIKREMKKEGVTDVKRISIKKNGNEIKTNTYIFTFDTPTLPSKVKIAYYSANVEVYVPNPLQCFRCQKFGHHEDKCQAQQAVCGRCSKTGHTFQDCNEENSQCANCHQDHPSSSRKCNFWKNEKEILRIKYTENVSFYEARKFFENRNRIIEQNTSNTSYANVSKPKPAECNTCKVLVEKLCHLFPEKATEILQLVQPTKDVPVSSSPVPASAPSATPEAQKSQNSKKPEQDKKTKQKDAPKQKISMSERSISRNTSVDSNKSTERKIKLPRCVAEGNEVVLQPIPASSNKYEVLSDMEADGEEEQSAEELPPGKT